MYCVSGDVLVYAQSTGSTVHGGPRCLVNLERERERGGGGGGGGRVSMLL